MMAVRKPEPLELKDYHAIDEPVMGTSAKCNPPLQPTFQPCEIVCLEYLKTRLYAEVMQIVPQRRVCWARPLVLLSTSELDLEPVMLHDLRCGSDLLLPIALFRVAFDTEAIPVLAHLYASSEPTDPDADRIAHQQLSQLVKAVCQAHPEAFQA
jgi:hypothetical protein